MSHNTFISEQKKHIRLLKTRIDMLMHEWNAESHPGRKIKKQGEIHLLLNEIDLIRKKFSVVLKNKEKS